MVQSRLSAQVRLANPAVAVIQVQGEINMFAEKVLMDAFNEATREGARVVLLNFTQLDYMNSSGIGLLVTLVMRANRAGQRLAACCLNHHYREIFNLTRLDEVITLYVDETEALQGIAAQYDLSVAQGK